MNMNIVPPPPSPFPKPTMKYDPNKYIFNRTEFDFHVSIYLYFDGKTPFATKCIEAGSFDHFDTPGIPILTGIRFQSVTNAVQLQYIALSNKAKDFMSHFEKRIIYLNQGKDVEFYFYLTSAGLPDDQG
ncbi:hypothetical protein ID850_18325 [Xenorhabdus sp. Flor]|uniref:hypothetical protein n=1 Tax=Xenorhabdus cabanillasii TaxID=351673 RepID=UPI0019CACB56|nr:hypothetical protein [Xenorhabdus sp. Flor]MBD2816648.1 hypothetical protein [Xenorhabdus sp. Flor]